MKTLNKALFCAAGAMMFASSVSAQEFVFEDVTVNEGAATADVAWTFTPNATVTSAAVDIPEAAGTLLTGVDLTDCILVENADLSQCSNNAGVVRITLTNFTDPLGPANGILRFSLDAAALDGATEVVDGTAVPGGEAPPGEVIQVTDGSVTVVAVTAILNVTPAAIPFGNQPTGTTSASQEVTVTNDGSDGVDLEITGLTFSGDFADAGTGTCAVGTTLPDTVSCTVDVEFSPTADGAAVGDLVVASDAGQVTNDTTTFSGTGIPSDANLSIAPANFSFPALDLNDPEACQDFVVSNSGVNDDVTGLAVAGPAAPFAIDSNSCGATLGTSSSCTVTICFNPTAAGNFNDTLDITSDANNVSATFDGEGTEETVFVIDPPFGPVDLGTGMNDETITANGLLSNTGSADGDFSCVLGGADAGVFSTTPSPLSGTVPAGGDVAFSLSCTIPSTAVDGDVFNATLTCSSPDDAAFDGGVHDLSCAALNVPMIPVPTMQPWALVLFSMMMLIAGGIGIRFFRAG